MKCNFTHILWCGLAILSFISCEQTVNNNEENKDNPVTSASTPSSKPKIQEIKPELSTEDAVNLNDQVTNQLHSIEKVLNDLQELDVADADSTLMFQKADSLIDQIHRFKIIGFDDKLPTMNSSDFMKATFSLLEVMDSKATMFKDYSGENSIPDLEWPEEWINELNQIIEPIYLQFIEAQGAFIKSQEDFIELHGAALTEV